MNYVTPRVFISSITFNSGQTLHFDRDDIVIFVGANNVGKSQALSQILQKASNPKIRPQRNNFILENYRTNYFPHQLIEKVEVTNEGSIDDFRQWTQERFSLVQQLETEIKVNSKNPPKYHYGDITLSGEYLVVQKSLERLV